MNRLHRWSFTPILYNFFNLGVFQVSSIALQLLIIPIISRNYGMAVFGQVALASSFAAFAASITNYGTNQTGIKEVAGNTKDNLFLSTLFYKILVFRFLAAIVIVPISVMLFIFYSKLSYWLWLGTIPLILAEIINPLFFLIGKEKIQWISWGNIVVKLLTLLLILLIPLHSHQATWINIMLGLPMVLYYLIVCIYIQFKESLRFTFPSTASLLRLAKENFYIMFNSTTVSLQQSIFLFTIAGFVSANTLGSYALVDKLLGACRQLISFFSNAVYPQAARLFLQSPDKWMHFKRTLQKIYTVLFGIGAIVIFFSAKYIVLLITKKENDTTELFVQMFSLVPLLLALNANNVLTLLLEKGYQSLFIISILILGATFLLSFFLAQFGNPQAMGWYPMATESSCLLIYLFFTNKKSSYVS